MSHKQKACADLNLGRRRVFWTTRPDACGTYDLCGFPCVIPGLVYIDIDAEEPPTPTPPKITSASAVSNPENTQLAHALTGTGTAPLTWSILGGADAGKFEIVGTTLRWAGNGTQNFETPGDVDLDNAYEVIVRLSSMSLTDDMTVTVTVTDVPDVLTITSPNAVSNVENTVLAHTLTATSDTTPLVWSIFGGADASKFEITGGMLRWAGDGTQDYDAPVDANLDNVYEVVVRVNAGSLVSNQTLTVTVTDVVEFVSTSAAVLGASRAGVASVIASTDGSKAPIVVGVGVVS